MEGVTMFTLANKLNIQNCSLSAETMRMKKEFTDVTLVSEDGKTIEAHKSVLAAGSQLLEVILKDTDKHHSWIFMTGVSYEHLTKLIEFLYLGVAKVEEKDSFIKMTQDLQLIQTAHPNSSSDQTNKQTNNQANQQTSKDSKEDESKETNNDSSIQQNNQTNKQTNKQINKHKKKKKKQKKQPTNKEQGAKNKEERKRNKEQRKKNKEDESKETSNDGSNQQTNNPSKDSSKEDDGREETVNDSTENEEENENEKRIILMFRLEQEKFLKNYDQAVKTKMETGGSEIIKGKRLKKCKICDTKESAATEMLRHISDNHMTDFPYPQNGYIGGIFKWQCPLSPSCPSSKTRNGIKQHLIIKHRDNK